ncbi:MAG: winged helix-turn-helix transcriptional regulator [Acidimicrobiia bacterium]|nr:winged helix-turn-helix transcriptional regulator [Acidimicrobiia bacterium]
MLDLRPRLAADATGANPPSEGTSHVVDYEMDYAVRAETPEQLRALGNVTRDEILTLLSERAATTSQLAEALGKPKGSVGYHVKVLEQAGFIRIVRTNKVRAMTEKYYGRTARTIIFGKGGSDDPFFMLDDVRREGVAVEGEALPMFTMRRARISEERAVEFTERLLAVAEEFIDLPREGDRVYGLVAGVYPTQLPSLGDDE